MANRWHPFDSKTCPLMKMATLREDCQEVSSQRPRIYIDNNVLDHLADLRVLGIDGCISKWKSREGDNSFILANIGPIHELWQLHQQDEIIFCVSDDTRVEFERTIRESKREGQRAIFESLDKSVVVVSAPMDDTYLMDGRHLMTADFDDECYYKQKHFDTRHLANLLYAPEHEMVDYFLTLDDKMLKMIRQHRNRASANDERLKQRVLGPSGLWELLRQA